jgi:REP element-mobilizing transposase RayT
MPDHLHLLVRLRPAISPSEFIQKVKSNSSRWMNAKKFSRQPFKWQGGCGIFSIGHSHVPYLAEYIDNQKDHHNKNTFQAEYIKLLNENGIKYDSAFLLEFHE